MANGLRRVKIGEERVVVGSHMERKRGLFGKKPTYEEVDDYEWVDDVEYRPVYRYMPIVKDVIEKESEK